jgi:hypothetical protein
VTPEQVIDQALATAARVLKSAPADREVAVAHAIIEAYGLGMTRGFQVAAKDLHELEQSLAADGLDPLIQAARKTLGVAIRLITQRAQGRDPASTEGKIKVVRG